MHLEIEEHIKADFSPTSKALRYGEDGFLGKQLRSAVGTLPTRWTMPVTEITAEQVAIPSGVTTAIETCAWTFMDAGDAVLVGRPYHMRFSIGLAARAGVKVISISFGKTDPFFLKGVARYGKVLLKVGDSGIQVKSLLLCSSHNPLGRCYHKTRLSQICASARSIGFI